MNIMHLSRAEYQTLSTNGTLTKNGVTYTFDPLNTEYVTPSRVEAVLLWENDNKSSTFAANTITMQNASDYQLIVVYFGYYYQSYVGMPFVNSTSVVGDQSTAQCYALFSGTPENSYRTYTSSTSGTSLVVSFENGVKNGASSNQVMIPYKIYGLK